MYREGPLLRSYIVVVSAFALILSAGQSVRAEAPEPASVVAVPLFAANAGGAAGKAGFEPLEARRWEFGPFENLGAGVGDRFGYYFFATGFQAGRNLTPIIHAGPLTGRFEFGANVMPLFQALTPSAYTQIAPGGAVQHIGGGLFTGASVTPVVFRWNFDTKSPRFAPFFQAQAGVLYTTHKFPPTIEVPKGTPGGTSVWNFRSGAGIGFHYFVRPRRSLDFGLNAEHISSASLGDRNPGVNASLQFQVGYSWWK